MSPDVAMKQLVGLNIVLIAGNRRKEADSH